MKKCSHCGSAMNPEMEVCPECREREFIGKPIKLTVCLVAAILAWIAFH